MQIIQSARPDRAARHRPGVGQSGIHEWPVLILASYALAAAIFSQLAAIGWSMLTLYIDIQLPAGSPNLPYRVQQFGDMMIFTGLGAVAMQAMVPAALAYFPQSDDKTCAGPAPLGYWSAANWSVRDGWAIAGIFGASVFAAGTLNGVLQDIAWYGDDLVWQVSVVLEYRMGEFALAKFALVAYLTIWAVVAGLLCLGRAAFPARALWLGPTLVALLTMLLAGHELAVSKMLSGNANLIGLGPGNDIDYLFFSGLFGIAVLVRMIMLLTFAWAIAMTFAAGRSSGHP